MNCLYEPGKILRLQILEDCYLEGHKLEPTITVKIIKAYKPFMESCFLEVEVQPPWKFTERIGLKLGDPRFGDRSLYKCQPVVSKLESAFLKFVQKVDIEQLIGKLPEGIEDDLCDRKERTIKKRIFPKWYDQCGQTHKQELGIISNVSWPDNPCTLSTVEEDVALFAIFRERIRREVKAYRRLGELQGTYVPRFISHVATLRTATSGSTSLKVPQNEGFLLELISGQNMKYLAKAPNEASTMIGERSPRQWGHLLSQAIKASMILPLYGVFTHDFSPQNVLVRDDISALTNSKSSLPSVVLIDFGRCDIHDRVLNDETTKCRESELICDMKMLLWRHSAQRDVWAALEGVACGRSVRLQDPEHDKQWTFIMHKLWTTSLFQNPTLDVEFKYNVSRYMWKRVAQSIDHGESIFHFIHQSIMMHEYVLISRAVSRIFDLTCFPIGAWRGTGSRSGSVNHEDINYRDIKPPTSHQWYIGLKSCRRLFRILQKPDFCRWLRVRRKDVHSSHQSLSRSGFIY